MVITERLKKRFCKECQIPINIFTEPYFSSRIMLYEDFYKSKTKWDLFLQELGKYKNEEEYFTEYNRVKDESIKSIKSTAGYSYFLEEDMNQFAVETLLSSKDIFHPMNDGRGFLSIDMTKANFSALYYYDPSIFDIATTWEDFIKKFTNNEHIIHSKYIRQVILGNCNPRRQVTYEKYLMDKVLEKIKDVTLFHNIVSFSNDEIVIDITGEKYTDIYNFFKKLDGRIEGIPVKVQAFTLHKVSTFYVKKIKFPEKKIEIKCGDANLLPFLVRALKSENVQENDLIFYQNGYLAKYIEAPKIEIPEELNIWSKNDD